MLVAFVVLLKILTTLPVSLCEQEHMFSKVDRTLTAIQSSMSEDRLETLVVLQAHHDDLPTSPATEDATDMFASVSSRRLNLII